MMIPTEQDNSTDRNSVKDETKSTFSSPKKQLLVTKQTSFEVQQIQDSLAKFIF
jgi:hypothetical protein